MTDIRTVKTVNAIRSAFTDLIIKNDKVFFPIKEITEIAGINRKTFYLHFECIEDLYADLEEITENKILEVLNKNGFFESNFSISVCLKSLLEVINDNKPLYEKLLLKDEYKFLFRNVKDKVKAKIFDVLKVDKNNLKNDMYAEFICSGLIKLFRVWAVRKNEMSEEELFSIAEQIVVYGTEGLKKYNSL